MDWGRHGRAGAGMADQDLALEQALPHLSVTFRQGGLALTLMWKSCKVD